MTLDEALGLAISHHQAGRLHEAGSLYQSILCAFPNHPQTLHLMGVLQDQLGHPENAERLIRQSLDIDPHNPAARLNLGSTLKIINRFDDAEAEYRKAIEIKPDYPQAYNNLGLLHQELGRLDQAVDCYESALRYSPDFLPSILNLGVVLLEQDDFPSAIAQFKHALAIDPDNLETLNCLGVALHDAGDFQESLNCLNKAIRLKNESPSTLTNLAMVLTSIGRFDEAILHLQKALSLSPHLPEAHNNLGDAYKCLGQLDEAEKCFRKALELNPAFGLPRVNLSMIQLSSGRPDLAIETLQDAIRSPRYAGMALNNLANAYNDMGDSQKAFDCYQKALQAVPPYAPAIHNYLYALNFIETATPEQILAEHLKWNQAIARKNIAPRRGIQTVGRPLKIGFVSPDFRLHPVGRFFLPLVQHLDPSRFQTFCYSDSAIADSITHQIRKAATRFETTFDLTHDRLAEKIREDGVDILVDLTLHMAGCRLECFALQPAPFQISWLGYCGTTGLSEITHRLTDPYLDPPGANDSHYSETNIRLPVCHWCYQPVEGAPPIQKSPQPNSITFGCLNNFSKVRDRALDLWETLLLQIPHARLLIHTPEGACRDRILDRWRRKKIDVERLGFIGRTSVQNYLDAYNQIDIALDPFPYAGGTTTCDALYMGVPVITLAGDRAVSRAGLSLLANVGLPQWVAQSPEQYLALAKNLALDADQRAVHAKTLRDRLIASPLMDAKRFARDFESAMLTLLNADK